MADNQFLIPNNTPLLRFLDAAGRGGPEAFERAGPTESVYGAGEDDDNLGGFSSDDRVQSFSGTDLIGSVQQGLNSIPSDQFGTFGDKPGLGFQDKSQMQGTLSWAGSMVPPGALNDLLSSFAPQSNQAPPAGYSPPTAKFNAEEKGYNPSDFADISRGPAGQDDPSQLGAGSGTGLSPTGGSFAAFGGLEHGNQHAPGMNGPSYGGVQGANPPAGYDMLATGDVNNAMAPGGRLNSGGWDKGKDGGLGGGTGAGQGAGSGPSGGDPGSSAGGVGGVGSGGMGTGGGQGEGGNGGWREGTPDTGDDGDLIPDEEVAEPVHENEAVLPRRVQEAMGPELLSTVIAIGNDPAIPDEQVLPEIIKAITAGPSMGGLEGLADDIARGAVQ